jgi:hypothetical protein
MKFFGKCEYKKGERLTKKNRNRTEIIKNDGYKSKLPKREDKKLIVYNCKSK